MSYASKYYDFSFESFTTESEFSELLGMIYLFPSLLEEDRRRSHSSRNYKLFFSGFLPLKVTINND